MITTLPRDSPTLGLTKGIKIVEVLFLLVLSSFSTIVDHRDLIEAKVLLLEDEGRYGKTQ